MLLAILYIYQNTATTDFLLLSLTDISLNYQKILWLSLSFSKINFSNVFYKPFSRGTRGSPHPTIKVSCPYLTLIKFKGHQVLTNRFLNTDSKYILFNLIPINQIIILPLAGWLADGRSLALPCLAVKHQIKIFLKTDTKLSKEKNLTKSMTNKLMHSSNSTLNYRVGGTREGNSLVVYLSPTSIGSTLKYKGFTSKLREMCKIPVHLHSILLGVLLSDG